MQFYKKLGACQKHVQIVLYVFTRLTQKYPHQNQNSHQGEPSINPKYESTLLYKYKGN